MNNKRFACIIFFEMRLLYLFFRAWDEHLLTSKKKQLKPKFYKALWNVFGGKYMLYGLGTLFDECVIRYF